MKIFVIFWKGISRLIKVGNFRLRLEREGREKKKSKRNATAR